MENPNIKDTIMETPVIKAVPNINGYTSIENWDALTLIKLLWKDGLLQTTKIKQKIGGIYTIYKNEWEQMCCVLKNLFIKEPKNLTFSKEQLYSFSQNLNLFKTHIKVLYTFCDGKNMGRVYPAKSIGFTTTRKKIRHTFCRDKWVDIDISNAHPNLLNQMYQGRYKTLNDYCLNRSKYFDLLKTHFTSDDGQQFLTCDDACKSYFIVCVLYNGSWDSWCADNGLPKVAPPDFHNDFMSEMVSIYQDLVSKHSELASDLHQHKDWNLQGTLISWILQDEERKCLESMVDYATKEKLIAKTKKDREVVLAYDGLQLLKSFAITTSFLRKMEIYILEQTKYDLKLTIKPFDKGFTDEELNFEITSPDVDEEYSELTVEKSDQYLSWKDEFEMNWCKIKNTACFMRTCYNSNGDFEKFILQTETQLSSAYKHECYFKLNKAGTSVRVSCIKEWLEDESMRCYDDAEVFPPPLICPPNKFNLWRPFLYQNDDMDAEHPDYDEVGVQMWCDHLKILCNHEKPVYEYVVSWVAHSIQFPAIKPECMITFVSDEGVGKNIFTSSLSSIYGAGKKLETPSPERECWGSFNSPMASSYMVILSETDKRNTGGAEGKIKALITDPPLVINPKGKDQFLITSYHRLITNSNSADPTKTHKGDRRNLIIRCSDEKKGDEEYFLTLTERLKSENTLRSVYACLKATDLSEWSFRKVPRTIYHDTIIEGNRPALEIFMEHFTINNKDKSTMELYGTQILQHFRKWREETGYAFDEKISEGVLVKRLLTELKLPVDTIVKLGRGNKGIKRSYNIVKLKQRFNITDGVCLLSLKNDDTHDIESEEEEFNDEEGF